MYLNEKCNIDMIEVTKLSIQIIKFTKTFFSE